MKLTEEYVKHCAVGIIELKCNRLVRLTDGNNKPISTFIEQGATIEAEKSVTNELFVLLKSDSEGFRAYGYIDKNDYDCFEVLNPQLIDRERLSEFLDSLPDEKVIDLLNRDKQLGFISCKVCPSRNFCEDNELDCDENIIAWLKGEN